MKNNDIDFYSSTNLKSYNLNESMRYQLGILDSLDAFTRVHSENVANLTCRLCEYMHLDKTFVVYCTMCAYLHDIGKQFIPPAILQKQGALTDEEYEVIKSHTIHGYKMCMTDLKLRPYAAGAKYHHEALDGSGYPEHLTKESIPLEGQIIRVADEFDAIVSKRQYKSHIGISDTLKILADETKPKDKNKYGKINPKILKVLFRVVIDDTEYEISCLLDYLSDIKKETDRLELVESYINKLQKVKKEKDREFCLEAIRQLSKEKETIETCHSSIEEYKNVYNQKKEIIDNLSNEVKLIKKLKV